MEKCPCLFLYITGWPLGIPIGCHRPYETEQYNTLYKLQGSTGDCSNVDPKKGDHKICRFVSWMVGKNNNLAKITWLCLTRTLLLICLSFIRENCHPVLICSSLRTAQLQTYTPGPKPNIFAPEQNCG